MFQRADALQKIIDSAPESLALPLGPVIRTCSTIQPEKLHWLWPGRFPTGNISFISGDPELGKSQITIDIAARLSRGVAFPDGEPCEPGDTIFLSAEDGAAVTIVPRLIAAEADATRIHILDAVRDLLRGKVVERGFNLETDITQLEEAFSKFPGTKLIVIDHISSYLGRIDAHRDSEVRGLLAPLKALAEKHRLTVICVSHLRKSTGPALYRPGQSIAFVASSRSTWTVAKDRQNPNRHLFVQLKNNLAPRQAGLAYEIVSVGETSRIKWLGAIHVTADEAIGDKQHGQPERARATELLKGLLEKGPMLQKDIQEEAEIADISWPTIRRAKETLGISHRRRVDGRSEWFTPENPANNPSNEP